MIIRKSLFVSICFASLIAGCGQSSVESEKPTPSVEASVGKFLDAPELPIEDTGRIEMLPAQYPSSYIFAHDMNFYSILDGSINIIDVAADTLEYKAMINAAQMASFAQSKSRNELYVAETYYSRGTHGDRTDVITVYDAQTLNVEAEIILPGRKRGLSVIQKGSFQLIDNERLAVIWNFTPASSALIVDLEKREVLTEVPTPGCNLFFPLAGQAFGSLCGDGSVASFSLNGTEIVQTSSEPFNDIENDPLFMKSAQIGSTRYFPTFQGSVRPINVGGEEAIALESWSLVTDAERALNWRPSGWQIVASQEDGNLFVLMQEDGKEGSHKSGGSQVWVFDVESQKKVKEIKLPNGGLSIEVTDGESGYLVVTNLSMGLDVFDLEGQLVRNISVSDTATPFLLHASK